MEYQQINPTSFIINNNKIEAYAEQIFYAEYKKIRNSELTKIFDNDDCIFITKDILSKDIINKCQCINCLELAYQILTIEF